MTNNDAYQPKPKHKFSFGLWPSGTGGAIHSAISFARLFLPSRLLPCSAKREPGSTHRRSSSRSAVKTRAMTSLGTSFLAVAAKSRITWLDWALGSALVVLCILGAYLYFRG
jgi:hypothetical protein